MWTDAGRYERHCPMVAQREEAQRLEDDADAYEAAYDDDLRRVLVTRGADPELVAVMDRDEMFDALDATAEGDEMAASFAALVTEWGGVR